jgi:PKD repeat protein
MGAAMVLVSIPLILIGMSVSAGHIVATASRPATGVGSCTLIGWNPFGDPANAKDLPLGKRPQSYKPDNYDCTGAKFAAPGVEFARFPQPRDFHVINKKVAWSKPVCRAKLCAESEWRPTAAINPLAPYFPPFTHFLIVYRENHTFDDYLGDCATTVQAGCNGQVESTNHISSVPNLHTLAKTYALLDSYSTGTQPPSGPNHWWLLSAQSSSSSQQQSYPAATGTQFDRFLGADTGPAGEGTNACTAQTGTGTGSSPYTFMMAGDFYWMLNSGSGYWRNPGTGNLEVLPVNRPGTSIPEELHYNEYTCQGQSLPDTTVGDDYLNFVSANGLPAYSYVELFNDHPGTYQDIPTNDSETYKIVNSIMSNSAYKDNTLIVVTEDDTQNGNNGPDHVSNTYRVPTVVIASPTYMKQHYLSHVAYTTSNVIAAMERVLQNVHPGIIDPNDNLGLSSLPMTTADQSALGDPLSDLWINGGGSPLSATASGTPTTGNAPLNVAFTGSATGGTAPYSYSWNFGDGSAASTAQNPSHTYTAAGTYTATLTVTDSASPAAQSTSRVMVTVNAVGQPLVATASAIPTSGQIPLNVAFTGTGTGGTPPYSYSWNFGDGSAASTAQNPSHTYTAAGTYTATLTVTDSSSPSQSATSSVTINAAPIAGTAPGAPTGLTATPGSTQVSLSWTAPASNGGVNITAYRVYRGTTSGGETPVTTGGCSGLGNVLSCTDTGLTNGQTYYYQVSAVNAIGEGTRSNEASAITPANTPTNTPTKPAATSTPTNTPTSGSNCATDSTGTYCLTGLTASATSVGLNTNVTLTASTSADVGPSTYYILIVDQGGAILTSCASGTSCATTVSSSLAATHTYTAYLSTSPSSNTANAQSSSVSVSWVGGATATATAVATKTPVPTATKTPPPAATNTPSATPHPPTATNTPLATATNTPRPTATNTPAPTNTPVSGNIVVNPGFESGPGVGWTEYSSGGYELIDTYKPHTGSYSADECNYNNCTEYVQQQITVPSNASLRYWWYMTSSEPTTTAYDYLKVQVYSTAGSLLGTLRTWSNRSTRNAWSQDTLSLAAYAGQTVKLRFTTTTDYLYPTNFFIDDVAVP